MRIVGSNTTGLSGAIPSTDRTLGGMSIIAGGNLINTSTVACLTATGIWTNASDRALKEEFTPDDARKVLDNVVALPVSTWNYRGENAGVRHIGPVAQDFYKAFGPGQSDRHIGTLDADGVALAAIQGLHDIVKKQEAEITSLQADVAVLKETVRKMNSEATVSHLGITTPAFMALCVVGFMVVGLRRKGGAQ